MVKVFSRRRRRKRTLSAAQREKREAARLEINRRVDHWSQVLGVRPNRVAIKDQRSRWGSASELGNVNFNWRISRLPEAIFDYIIIHELAHLRELNHSAAFWRIVAKHCPDYQLHRRWLRRHGPAKVVG